MEQQTSYKRTWREPPATLDTAAFKVLWKKQRLAEVRAAILRGDWPSPVPSDSDSSDDEDRCSASTSCTNSPRHSGRPRHSNEQQDRHHHEQDSEEDAQFEEALQEAADTELQAVLARLQEQHELQLQQAHAAVKEVEEEHTATTKQIADIQAQLDELKRNKHELFQELKLVSYVSARILGDHLSVCSGGYCQMLSMCINLCLCPCRRTRQLLGRQQLLHSKRLYNSSSANGSSTSRCHHRPACLSCSSRATRPSMQPAMAACHSPLLHPSTHSSNSQPHPGCLVSSSCKPLAVACSALQQGPHGWPALHSSLHHHLHQEAWKVLAAAAAVAAAHHHTSSSTQPRSGWVCRCRQPSNRSSPHSSISTVWDPNVKAAGPLPQGSTNNSSSRRPWAGRAVMRSFGPQLIGRHLPG